MLNTKERLVFFMTKSMIEFYSRLAKGLAAQFGPNCEVVVYDLQATNPEHSVVAIENGHISGRNIGDGPSQIVLESIQHNKERLEDRLAYLTKTKDGKILKSSTLYIRDSKNKVVGILGINYDITLMLAMEDQIKAFTGTMNDNSETEPVSLNIADLLDDLIDQSVRTVGKPAALMTKEEKVQVVRQLNKAGAFLITKSGPKVCQYLGISKYTLYSYLDEIKSNS